MRWCKVRWCRAERGQSERAREEEKVYGWGARNGALVIQKRATSGERGLRRVREMARVEYREKATENVHNLGIEPLHCPKKKITDTPHGLQLILSGKLHE